MHFKRTVGPIGLMEGLDSLIFNHHYLNPLVLTDSLIFTKSLVTDTAHHFPRAMLESFTENEVLCLTRAFSVEVWRHWLEEE